MGSQSSLSLAVRSHTSRLRWLRRFERAPAQVGHTEPERCQRPDIRGDRIISEVASYDLPQPSALFGDRPVHSAL
jgi:hypothetical protein